MLLRTAPSRARTLITRHLRCAVPKPLVSRSFQSDADHSEQLPRGAKYWVPPHGLSRMLRPGEQAMVSQQSVSVAVIGAAGVMGRSIATGLARDLQRMTGCSGVSTLQLVGIRVGNTSGVLIGLCSEFRDAFEEVCPCLEVVLDLEAVKADIIIMCAGATLSQEYKSEAEVARANIQVFSEVAQGVYAQNPNSLVMVVSNPMELGIAAMIEAGYRSDQVFGTGAFLQGLRFRREVSEALGVSRQNLSGLVLGRHGLGMVPIWSSMHLSSHASTVEARDKLEKLREEGLARLPMPEEELRVIARKVKAWTESGDALAAGRLVNSQPPEWRVALRRYLTFFSGLPFARVGNAEAVCRLVGDILSGQEINTAAHVQVDGKFMGLHGIIGAPVTISGRGVTISHLDLHPKEEAAVKASSVGALGVQQAAASIKKLRGLVKRPA